MCKVTEIDLSKERDYYNEKIYPIVIDACGKFLEGKEVVKDFKECFLQVELHNSFILPEYSWKDDNGEPRSIRVEIFKLFEGISLFVNSGKIAEIENNEIAVELLLKKLTEAIESKE